MALISRRGSENYFFKVIVMRSLAGSLKMRDGVKNSLNLCQIYRLKGQYK